MGAIFITPVEMHGIPRFGVGYTHDRLAGRFWKKSCLFPVLARNLKLPGVEAMYYWTVVQPEVSHG